MNLFLVLGNQLFGPHLLPKEIKDQKKLTFFMREDKNLASYFKFHKHKIVFFFSAMRAYRDELVKNNYRVHYEMLDVHEKLAFEESLLNFIKTNKVEKIYHYEIEDKFFETRLKLFFGNLKCSVQEISSPMFLTTRKQFQNYLSTVKKPFMKSFYQDQRKRLDILIEDNKPIGGLWSFDAENRLALPKVQIPPKLPKLTQNTNILEVKVLVDRFFGDHPGDVANFWLPVDRTGARSWLKSFFKDRLSQFGPYEDAIAPHSEFVYHSVLTPFLNVGLLTPKEVVSEVIKYSKENDVPLPSLEGFVRQVIGWREFIRGIYQNYSEQQESENFWKHKRKLSPVWYAGNTGILPLDTTIKKVLDRGYAHHIERLMVVGSLMLLLEVDPKEAYKWFMEMFLDSADWVMGPNVFGMALFSDGGIFATKPYICGSNYLRKMGGYKKDSWCDGVDGLYWQFIKKHEKFFLKNPRMSVMVKSSQRISSDRWKVLEASANELRSRLTL
jgi:deoxyribodipyrimidine photolyase-related protein